VRRIAAVVRAEVGDKKLVFPASLLIGAFPVVAGLLRPVSPADARESAIVLAGLTGGALAAIFGLGSTAGDIASRRADFYLARPLTAFELWAGKLAGNLFVVLGAAAIALLPSVVAGGSRRGAPLFSTIRSIDAILPFGELGAAGPIVAAVALLTILYLFAQAAGVAALARSPWVTVDAGVAAAAVVVAAGAARRLRLAKAPDAAEGALLAFAAVSVAAVAVGCYRAVKEGSDVRRAFRAQSRAVVPIAAAALLVALFAAWVLHPAPASLATVSWVAPAPRGDWFALSGPARWHHPIFVENLETGEFLRSASFPVFSPDGSRAAWSTAAPGLPEPSFTPHTVSLDDARHPATAWETKGLHEPPLLVFSPDASRFAIVASDQVVVWNSSSGRMVAAARPPAPLWEQSRGATCATFAGNDRLLVYAVRPAAERRRAIEIFAFDAAARTFRRTGTAGPFAATFPILADASRGRLLVREKPAALHLLDAESGAVRRTFAGGAAAFRTAIFLTGGGIALFESEHGAGTLLVLSSDGDERSRIPLGPADRAFLVGERRPGAVLLVAGTASELRQRRGRAIVADVGTGKVETWAEGVLPAAPYASFLSGDPGATPAPGSAGTRLFFTPAGALVELAGPGRLRPLFPPD
jgi:hypothetical protein